MALPPGFLDELRTRVSLSDVVGPKVVWDTRKSNHAKGDMWAPCPFHHEKTPSFHVDDQKGYYYCFGCHAKGDAISFLREQDNMSFMDAVESLAQLAGMQMPAPDPKARERSDLRTELFAVMEQALRHFRLNLASGAGAAARDYLAGRGLQGAALERWEIGFAKDGWQVLWEHLRGQGVSEEKILQAGLAKPSRKEGGRPYDVFRNRIIYPIRDAQGRCIAFGGRAMDPEDGAKYLNSPETPLFDKGRSLYNQGPARSACGKGQPLIVAEGYMDVIALSEAGFPATVAPLGTAITEDQLRLIWRMAEEPVIALDGDKAGLRAALRLIDLALPLLEPGKTLRFCILPQGQDPDDLLKSGGAGAMSALLDKATPLVEMLWRRETEGRQLDSPERRAALDRDLRFAVAKIPDQGLKGHYMDALRIRRNALFERDQPARRASAPRRGFGEAPARWQPASRPVAPSSAARASVLASGTDAATEELREAVILALVLDYPELLEAHCDQLEEVRFVHARHAQIAQALLTAPPCDDPQRLHEAVVAQIGTAPLETFKARPHLAMVPPLRNSGMGDVARICLLEELAKLAAVRGTAEEVAEATDALSRDADEWVTWRLSQTAEARHRAARGQDGDRSEYDIAPNGARMDRDERSQLDRLLNVIRQSNGPKPPP